MKQVSSRTIYFYKIRGFKQIYALVLAVLPLFSSIVVPFTNQSISYVLCYIMFPFLAWRLSLKKIFSKNLIFVYAFFYLFYDKSGRRLDTLFFIFSSSYYEYTGCIQ